MKNNYITKRRSKNKSYKNYNKKLKKRRKIYNKRKYSDKTK